MDLPFLYEYQGTRSPLVNLGAYELGLDISMADLTMNPHPVRLLPWLTDDEDALVFESGPRRWTSSRNLKRGLGNEPASLSSASLFDR
jgi:hypothetical protein